MDKFILLDGAMGTTLQRHGIKLGQHPDVLSITDRKLIESIHKSYIESGSDVIYTNTFGANEYKLEGSGYSVEEVITASVEAAKEARRGTDAKIALDIGPVGQLLEPSGTLSFERAYEMFKRQIVCGAACGADLIVIETMTDLYEVKAALLAAKENSNLPVYVTMTFEKNMRTFAGCDIMSAAITLEGLGADAIGINCSLGPDEIYPMAEKLCKCTTLPVIVKPNAGLPNLSSDGYDVTPQKFAESMKKIIDLGVSIIGGCCGTTPEYIAELKKLTNGASPKKREVKKFSAVCSGNGSVVIDGVRIIGERINPTGKKLFKQALINNDMDYILRQAVAQVDAGADILDVNVGLPEINEKEMMLRVVKNLQAVVNVPLQIDSSDPEVIEAALRIYNGKAIVNSVNGETAVLDRILPVVKKYGCSVVGLTMDENGIPLQAEERFAIAEKILKSAEKYGISKEDVYIDCLTLTASAQQKEVRETLRAMQMVKEKLGLKTVLGVSNISFGLPNRELINHSFLMLAFAHGLDLPIINPNIESMTDAVAAFNVLYNEDKNSEKYISKYSDVKPAQTSADEKETDIGYAVLKGLKKEAAEAAQRLIKETDPMDIVNEKLIPALDEVGKLFENGTLFLPQLLRSAAAAQEAFEVIKQAIAQNGTEKLSKGRIIMATVKGDVHDIGKNIVKVILENYGFDVIDLGKDVPPEVVVETAIRENVRLIGLSALMTTTLKSMEETINQLRQSGHKCTVFAGGAVLTEDYAKKIGADYYAKDAKQSADIAKAVLGN